MRSRVKYTEQGRDIKEEKQSETCRPRERSRVKHEPNSRAKYTQRGREISMGKAVRNIYEMQSGIYIQYRDLTRGYRVMKIEKGGGGREGTIRV